MKMGPDYNQPLGVEMRRTYLIMASSVALVATTAATAQSTPQPAQSADDIVCKLTGDCGETTLDESKKLDKGDEAAFSFRRSSEPQSAATAPMQRNVATSAPTYKSGQLRPGYGREPNRVVTPTAPRNTSYTPGGSRGIDMRINFASGSARMDGPSAVNAAEFAKALTTKSFAGRVVEIQGHTDSVGNRAANLKLSRERAEAVAQYMISLGVSPDQLVARGYGPDRPIPGLSSKASANRRVQIVIVN